MKIIFDYPDSIDSLEITLATKAYDTIWQESGEKIVRSMVNHTGLHFQQDEIHVVIHDGQSMSGRDGVPMRLSVNNTSLYQKRNALVHELSHRLLFGNGLYAPKGKDSSDEDETRVFLFQGDVLKDVFGQEAYDSWLDINGDDFGENHQRLIAPILKLSVKERHEKIKQFVAIKQVIYHASQVKGLNVITPQRTLSKDVYIGDFVFATKDKILATMYLATKGYAVLLEPRDTPPNIVICADEKEYLKTDSGGAIYELPSNSFMVSPQKGLTDFELVSKRAISPVNKVAYESSLDAMKSLGIKIRFVDQRTFNDLVNNPNQKELIRKLPTYEQ